MTDALGDNASYDKAKPARIAVLVFMHETVTFLKNDTELGDFIYPGSPVGGDTLLNLSPDGTIGGFVKVAREHSGVELVGLESPLFPKTGTASGWITNEAYEHFVSRFVAELKDKGPFDGVFLALHGAMAVRGVPRPEADIARRVREAVGSGAYLAATFDPHGNEDEAFLQHADLAFTVKYYPHYDYRLQSERAARTLIRAIRGDYRPAHATLKVPLITPTVAQWTGSPAWMSLINRALRWEAKVRDCFVNVFFGFPWADVPDAGMTFQVITNGKPELARKIAEDMAMSAWRDKDALLAAADVQPIGAGVAMAKEAVAGGRAPVVLADHSDRSGHATWLLREILDQGLSKSVVATIADPKALDWIATSALAPGDTFDLPVGGLVDESAGEPVRIKGKLVHVGSVKESDREVIKHAAVALGDGNVVIISRYLVQMVEPSALKQFGVNHEDFDVFAIKSRVHFRDGFDDSGFAKAIYIVEPPEPFLGGVRLDILDYQNLKLTDFYPYGDRTFP